MDRQIQVQRAALVDDGFAKTEAFANHGAPLWCEKTDVSDGEKARAGAVEANLMSRFKVRYSAFSADLSPKDRLVFEGVTFGINGVKELGGRREWLEISATARADG
ncbi:head-tail adaptor protein [Yoonia sp.]|uniref:head-tail adaptor protein n=1 Tax=Yoonia sp. TaxID=2212373 RepID=UPI002DF85464|nr:head-tail adaptor protein [Yoonia sp.]